MPAVWPSRRTSPPVTRSTARSPLTVAGAAPALHRLPILAPTHLAAAGEPGRANRRSRGVPRQARRVGRGAEWRIKPITTRTAGKDRGQFVRTALSIKPHWPPPADAPVPNESGPPPAVRGGRPVIPVRGSDHSRRWAAAGGGPSGATAGSRSNGIAKRSRESTSFSGTWPAARAARCAREAVM